MEACIGKNQKPHMEVPHKVTWEVTVRSPLISTQKVDVDGVVACKNQRL